MHSGRSDSPDAVVKDGEFPSVPRQEAAHDDCATMSDADLLAAILGQPAQTICRQLLARHGDLRRLAAAHPADWRDAGLTSYALRKLEALFEIAKRYGETPWMSGDPFRSAQDVYAHYRERLAAETVEFFIAVLLDNKHRKIRDVVVGQGSLTASIVHPRDVYACVLRSPTAAVIFVHNHPSGDPTPSREDLDITRRLREVGDLIGIRVLDHVVIGKGRYVSFVDDGYW